MQGTMRSVLNNHCMEQVGASCICCWRPMHHLPPSRFATTVPNATLVALQDLEKPHTFFMLRSLLLSRVFGHVFLEPGWHLVIKREPQSHATRSEMTLTNRAGGCLKASSLPYSSCLHMFAAVHPTGNLWPLITTCLHSQGTVYPGSGIPRSK